VVSTSSILSARPDSRGDFERDALPCLGAVYGFALRLTRRREDAHDLTQDTFLRAFQRFSGFTQGTNCKAWLFTIAYSIFVNRYHRQRREPAALPIDQAVVMESSGATRSSSTAARAAAAADVEAALAELMPEFRSAVLLVDVEGLSYDEAARVLACPVGTVRSRLFRARKFLADRLRAYTPERRQS
jgi:RNA polymerase sigma-70 factor (ECF subfamily)